MDYIQVTSLSRLLLGPRIVRLLSWFFLSSPTLKIRTNHAPTKMQDSLPVLGAGSRVKQWFSRRVASPLARFADGLTRTVMRSDLGPRTYYSAPSSPVDRSPVPLWESHEPARKDCLRPPIVSRCDGWNILAARFKRAQWTAVRHASPADLLDDASAQVVAPLSLSQRVPAPPSARGRLLLRRANTSIVPSTPRVAECSDNVAGLDTESAIDRVGRLEELNDVTGRELRVFRKSLCPPLARNAGPRLTLLQMSPLPRAPGTIHKSVSLKHQPSSEPLHIASDLRSRRWASCPVAASQLSCRPPPTEDTKPWSLHWVEVAHIPQPPIRRQHQQPMQYSPLAAVRKHGLSTEPVPVSAYVGSSKNLKDLKVAQVVARQPAAPTTSDEHLARRHAATPTQACDTPPRGLVSATRLSIESTPSMSHPSESRPTHRHESDLNLDQPCDAKPPSPVAASSPERCRAVKPYSFRAYRNCSVTLPSGGSSQTNCICEPASPDFPMLSTPGCSSDSPWGSSGSPPEDVDATLHDFEDLNWLNCRRTSSGSIPRN